MLKRLVNEARFTVVIETTGPLLIKSGYATITGPDMTPVLTTRNGITQVYIPGSSLKGVFRSHIEKVIRTLRPNDVVVADPFKQEAGPDQSCNAWFVQRRKQEGEPLDNAKVYAASDPVARLFGSTFFIGRVSIGDAYLHGDTSNRLPTEQRDGVGIDRLTGGAAHGAKFELEVVTAGTVFQTQVLLRNFECWQLGALLLVVQDMEDELVRLGSGKSRGLGAVRGQVEQVDIHHLDRVGATVERGAREIWGLGRYLCETEEHTQYGTLADDRLTVEIVLTQEKKGIRAVQVYAGESLKALKQQAIQEFVRRMETFPVYQSGEAWHG